MSENQTIAFGPVPSRRLGRSLGINNIPAKVCSYACVYCQLGQTLQLAQDRKAFYNPDAIVQAVGEQVEGAQRQDEPIDYLTFVPDGEPTLDRHLGQEIDRLKSLGIRIAVISNASLIHWADVQAELRQADWVSLKVDAVWDAIWHRINRPYGTLDLDQILKGIREFADAFDRKLVTETMLVAGVNDGEGHLRSLARVLREIQPDTAYLSVPTRPPAEPWVEVPDEAVINRAFQILSERLDSVGYLIGYEGDAFASTGDAAKDLLSITAVHPMRRSAVEQLLKRDSADWSVVDDLLDRERLIETVYDGSTYYMRRLTNRGATH